MPTRASCWRWIVEGIQPTNASEKLIRSTRDLCMCAGLRDCALKRCQHTSVHESTIAPCSQPSGSFAQPLSNTGLKITNQPLSRPYHVPAPKISANHQARLSGLSLSTGLPPSDPRLHSIYPRGPNPVASIRLHRVCVCVCVCAYVCACVHACARKRARTKSEEERRVVVEMQFMC